MPRLPGIEKVARVSADGLRLPALQAPAVDPTGAALQDFGQSLGNFGKALGEFDQKRKALKAAEDAATARSVDADLTQYRSGLIETPPAENSDDTGPDETDPVQRRLSAYDQFAADRLEGIGAGPLRKRADAIVAKGRETLELRSRIEDHNQRLGSFSTMLDGTLETVRATAAQQPDLLEVSRDRGLSAVREAAKVMGWTDDVLREKEQQFDRELLAGVIQGRIGRGEAPQVLELLRDAEMTALFDEATIADLTQEAEARHGSEVAAILSGLDIHGEAILRTGRGVEGLAERAETTLSPEDHAVFQANERRFQAVRDHGVRFDRKPRSDLEAALETSFPGEWASEEDQETFQALRDKTSVMLLERQRDPAGVAGRDPVVESLHRTGRGAEARALSLELQKQMEVPEEQRRLLSNAEAQSKAAALNRMPAALRVQELAALKATDEKQYLRMVAELSQHGLDRPAQALAVVVGNEALTDLLASAQTQGRVKLRENATDEERAAVTSAVASALDRIADEEGIDASGFGFAVEDLAFQFFNLTGDAETAAEDAATLFARQLETIAPKESVDAMDADTLFGGASVVLTSAEGGDGEDPTENERNDLSAPRLIEWGKDLRKFIDDSWDLDDASYEKAAEEASLNPDRALLLREILRAGETGMTEAQKAEFLERIKTLPGDLPNGFRTLINSLTVGKKQTNARDIGGILIGLESIKEGGKGEPSILQVLFDALSLFSGGRRKSSDTAGSTRGKASNSNIQIERDARKFNLNASRPASRTILENLDMTVDEYISKFRQPTIRRRIPGEFLDGSVREALESKNKTVIKLLRDGRFSK